jgi:hypothetical protein
MTPMTIPELKTILSIEGIDPAWYSLDGCPHEDCYMITDQPNGWAVFYFEHGHIVDRCVFRSESEACEHLLSTLLRTHPRHVTH